MSIGVSDAERVRANTAISRDVFSPLDYVDDEDREGTGFSGSCTISCETVDSLFGNSAFFQEEPTW